MATTVHDYWRTEDVVIAAGVDGESPAVLLAGDEALSLIILPLTGWVQSEINVKVTPDGGTRWVYIMSTNIARLALMAELSTDKSGLTTTVVVNPCLYNFKLVSPVNQVVPQTVTLVIIKRARL